jgi:probable LLM family oxidoreductase
MQIGIDSFVGSPLDPVTGARGSDAERVRQLLEEIKLADEVGLDVFGIGEHHREEFIASAPAVLLAAAAAITKNIRLSSAVTVLSSDDPVRVFQDFATLDLISNGRAEIIIGRGSFIESYPLFGFDLKDYNELFSEKLDLLLKLRENTYVHWSGKHRAALTGQGVFPRPLQNPLPVYIGVGGTPNSFVRAGTLGLPLIVAIIGGEPHRFRPLIDLYREAGRRAGHAPEKLTVGIHSIGLVGDSIKKAADEMWPAYSYMFSRIGKERGWPPQSRAQFDLSLSPQSALLVGDPETVAEKILYENEALGGISRMTLMISGGSLPHKIVMHAIELLGTRVAPIVKKHLTQPEPALAASSFQTRS